MPRRARNTGRPVKEGAMIEVQRQVPQRLFNRRLLILGAALFIPAYGAACVLLARLGVEPRALVSLLISFDRERLEDFVLSFGQGGNAVPFAAVYLLNALSSTGFAMLLIWLSLAIARKRESSSAFQAPLRAPFRAPFRALSAAAVAAAPLIALSDYAFSALFLGSSARGGSLSQAAANLICASYILRLALLYALLAWYLFCAALFLAARRKRRARG
jgi:hypothetical protein